MKQKDSHEIYVFDNSHFFALNLEESIGYGISDLPELFKWISAYKCEKCGHIMALSGEAELVEREEREMGPHDFYHDENTLECPQCKNAMNIEIEFDHYAMGWSCSEDLSGVEGVIIDGLEWLAEGYYKSERTLREKEELEGTASLLTSRLNDLLEKARQNRMYVLIVEGEDDRAIWEQFLLKEGVSLELIDIPLYEDGGMGEAIKKASMFRGKKLRLIPHKLIIDSDNDVKSAVERLEEKKIEQKNYCILKEKEIESYLLDEEAIARVLSVDVQLVRNFNADLKGAAGKERLDKIFINFTTRKPNAQAKALVARAIETPEEIMSVVREIRNSLAMPEDSGDDYS
jgi:hypothetical protein